MAIARHQFHSDKEYIEALHGLIDDMHQKYRNQIAELTDRADSISKKKISIERLEDENTLLIAELEDSRDWGRALEKRLYGSAFADE